MSDLIETTDEKRVRDALAVLVCANWDAEDYLPEDFDGSPLYEAGYLSSSQDITGEWETRLTPKGRALIKTALKPVGDGEVVLRLTREEAKWAAARLEPHSHNEHERAASRKLRAALDQEEQK